MKAIIKKYGRWNEASNWQRESTKEKEVSREAFEEFKKFGGFEYNERYNEFYTISEDKHRMTVITVVE